MIARPPGRLRALDPAGDRVRNRVRGRRPRSGVGELFQLEEDVVLDRCRGPLDQEDETHPRDARDAGAEFAHRVLEREEARRLRNSEGAPIGLDHRGQGREDLAGHVDVHIERVVFVDLAAAQRARAVGHDRPVGELAAVHQIPCRTTKCVVEDDGPVSSEPDRPLTGLVNGEHRIGVRPREGARDGVLVRDRLGAEVVVPGVRQAHRDDDGGGEPADLPQVWVAIGGVEIVRLEAEGAVSRSERPEVLEMGVADREGIHLPSESRRAPDVVVTRVLEEQRERPAHERERVDRHGAVFVRDELRPGQDEGFVRPDHDVGDLARARIEVRPRARGETHCDSEVPKAHAGALGRSASGAQGLSFVFDESFRRCHRDGTAEPSRPAARGRWTNTFANDADAGGSARPVRWRSTTTRHAWTRRGRCRGRSSSKRRAA